LQLAVVDGDHLAAGRAGEVLGVVDDAGDPGTAPGALAFELIETNDGADQRGEDAEDDEGNSDEDADAGDGEHGANDKAYRSDYDPEEEAAEGVTDGVAFVLSGLRGGMDFAGVEDPAVGTEAPMRIEGGGAFRALREHWFGHGISRSFRAHAAQDSAGGNAGGLAPVAAKAEWSMAGWRG
jgi:hypothetical protein